MNGVKTEPKEYSSEDDDDMQMSDPQLFGLLYQLENYTPTVPDGVSEYYLNKAGMNTEDSRIVRLISLAGQEYISDILNDAMQLSKMKGSAQGSRSKVKDKRLVLTMDDLAPALAERGIKVKKPAYYN